MVVNRRGIALSMMSTMLAIVVVLACSVALVAQRKDDKKDDKKQSDAQKKEILDIVKIVDAAAAGQAPTNDFGLSWAHEDYLKATANKEYIPFTVTFDASKATSPNVAFYWRVVAKDAAAPTATLTLPAKKDDKKDDKKPVAPQIRVRRHQLRARKCGAGRHGTVEPSVHRDGGHVRRLRRDEGASLVAEERIGAEGLDRQADDHRARLLVAGAQHQFGDRRDAHRTAGLAAVCQRADRASVRART